MAISYDCTKQLTAIAAKTYCDITVPRDKKKKKKKKRSIGFPHGMV